MKDFSCNTLLEGIGTTLLISATLIKGNKLITITITIEELKLIVESINENVYTHYGLAPKSLLALETKFECLLSEKETNELDIQQ